MIPFIVITAGVTGAIWALVLLITAYEEAGKAKTAGNESQAVTFQLMSGVPLMLMLFSLLTALYGWQLLSVQLAFDKLVH